MDQFKHMMDGVSLVAVLTGIFNMLPAFVTVISGMLSAIWFGIRIYEYIKTSKAGE